MPFTAESVINNAPGKGITMPGRPSEGGQVTGFPTDVVFCQSKVTGTAGTGGLAISGTTGTATGVYVPATPNKCNMGVLSAGENFFFSDQFGGCDFTVLRDNNGNWAGSHVYSSDTCRQNIAAVPNGWEVVHTWRSSPYARKYGMSGSIAVCCFVTGTHLKFVVVRITGFPPTVGEAVMSASVVLNG